MSRLRLPRTLRGRLALAATLAAAVVLAITGTAVVASFSAREHDRLDESLSEQAARLQRSVRELARFGPGPGPGAPVELLQGSGGFVRITVGDTPVFQGGDANAGDVPLPGEAGFSTVEIAGEDWRVHVLEFRQLGAAGPRIQVAAPLQPVRARVAGVRRTALIAGIIGLIATALAVRWLAGLALRPLAALRGGAARVSTTRDLTARLPEGTGPEEVDDLASSLNAMLGRLEGSAAQTESALRASRRFTADAGHELRTPLTSLSANLDTLARNPALPPAERARVLIEMAADERRLTALLDNLQALARGDAGVGDRTELVDLADVADAALADARRRHPATGFALAAPEAAPVQGAEDGLRMIVDNLLENAARHGGGHVEVGVAASNGSATLTVDDDGPGIPVKERERVLARFARGTSARGPGSGLGLAIVAQQTALHGGRVEIEEAPLGGARVRVELPTRAAERPPRTGTTSP